MRKTLIFALFVLSILAFGCAKPAAEEPAPMELPPMTTVEEAQKEAPTAEKPAADNPAAEKPEAGDTTSKYQASTDDDTSIGNRASGEEAPIVEEETSTGTYEVKLLPNKTMDVGALTISVGESVSFKNEDVLNGKPWPHKINIEQVNPADDQWVKMILIADGDRIDSGQVWTYTFNEKGVFLARDVFSGDMRMNVTVE